MNILITGSEGSLAQIVIPYLLKSGHNILGVDNFSRYGKIDRKRSYDFICADLSDTKVIQSIFKKNEFDVAFHFAALVYGVVGFHKKPADTIADNNLITINLLKYGHEKIKKFIYLSSSMVYEKSFKWPHIEEDTITTPVMSTAYGLSKYIGERVIQSYEEQYGIKFVIWRPFNIITPFETPEEEGFSHVFSDMIDKIINKQQYPLNIFGDGKQIRCFTNIYDVAEVIAKYSLEKKTDNQIINIGNPEPITVSELAQKVVHFGKQFGILDNAYKLKFNYQPIYDDDVKKRIPDVNKLKKMFGWNAKIKIDESLKEYMEKEYKLDFIK
jgi:UDP-glucose 4-epimerase